MRAPDIVTELCDAAQINFVKALIPPGGRVTAVGDDAQAIYRFRGTDSSAFQQYIDTYQHPGLQTSLTINYRQAPDCTCMHSTTSLSDDHADPKTSVDWGLYGCSDMHTPPPLREHQAMCYASPELLLALINWILPP